MYEIGSELTVPKAIFTNHVGSYLGNEMVIHNSPEKGENVVSLSNFAKGRSISISKAGVADKTAFLNRVKKTVANPAPYNLLTSNCEHTASKLRTGVSSSPQLWFWGAVGLATILVIKSKSKSK